MKQILKESKLNISEQNVSNILSQTCLLTDLTIKGKKGSISLDRHLDINRKPACIIAGKAYADMTDSEKQEVEAWKVGKKIRTTLTSYIPKDKIDKINTIQGKLRTEYYDACTGPNYMTTKAYEDFKVRIDEVTKDLDNILITIENSWTHIMNTFKNDVLVKYPYLKEADVDKLVASLGTGEDFRNSYSIKLEYTPIPNSYAVQGMATKYQQEAERAINKKAMKDIENIIGINLNAAFQSLNRILISHNSLKNMNSKIAIASKTKGSIVNLGLELDSKLGFLQIDSLNTLIESIDNTTKIKDDVSLIEGTELCLAQIYDYMKNYDLKDEYLDLTDSVLDEVLLEAYL